MRYRDNFLLMPRSSFCSSSICKLSVCPEIATNSEATKLAQRASPRSHAGMQRMPGRVCAHALVIGAPDTHPIQQR